MALALIILFIIIIYFLWHTRKFFYGRYILLFSSIWFATMILMAFDVCQVNGILSSTMAIILSSTIFYIVGYCLFKKNRSDNTYSFLAGLDHRVNRLFSSRIVILFYLVMIIILFYQFVQILPLLLIEGNMGGGLRVDALLGNLYSPLFYTFNVYVFAPLYNITLPISGYLIITNKRVLAQILTAIYCILYPSLFGGRIAFFVFGLAVLICYFLCKNNVFNYVRKDMKRLAYMLILFVMVLFSIMSIAKSGDVTNMKGSLEELSDDMLRQPLRYFVCPQKAFDYAIHNNYTSRMGGDMYGRATFASIDYYVNPIINNMEGGHNPNANSIIGHIIQEEQISLSNNVPTWNALYTALLHFYLDFGVVGCLLFSFLFGFLTRWTIIQFLEKGSLAFFALSFFFIKNSILSILSFQPVGGDVIPFMLYISLWIIYDKNLYGKHKKRFLY